jgi:hypothetical protein
MSNGDWKDYGDGKEEATPLLSLHVWSDKGFTEIKRVIRHKCGKKIKRVITDTGCVDVTEDHSLLTPMGEKIKPSQVKIGDELLHHNLPYIVDEIDIGLHYIDAYFMGRLYRGENISENIMNGPKHIREAFWNGYIANKERYNVKRGLGAASLFFISSSLGHNPTLAPTDKPIDNCIKKIIDLEEYNGYVYDLETENHHFSAGVGRLIVHNTDSSFVVFGDEHTAPLRDNSKKIHEWGVRMAHEATALFEKPMELEYETCIEWMILVNKKQYVGAIIPPFDYKTNSYPPVRYNINDGTAMKSRGLMFVKRGAAPIMQDVQKELVMMALLQKKEGKSLKEMQNNAMEKLEDFSYKLMAPCNVDANGVGRFVPEKQLIVTQKIGATYKNKGNHLNVYREHLVREGKVVNPGDRIPFLLVKKVGAKKQGQKMELPELRKDPIDYLYYLEKRGVKPYESVLGPGFELRGFMKFHLKLLKQREKMMTQLKKKHSDLVKKRGERDCVKMDRKEREKRRSFRCSVLE